ncbi:MAG TPA: hypothetical protein VMW43_04265 [Bacteroidota bacterium]|nr:hypothetical protein [Bacteroidota bacterium]
MINAIRRIGHPGVELCGTAADIFGPAVQMNVHTAAVAIKHLPVEFYKVSEIMIRNSFLFCPIFRLVIIVHYHPDHHFGRNPYILWKMVTTSTHQKE